MAEPKKGKMVEQSFNKKDKMIEQKTRQDGRAKF
jgi:hypothetical protein